MALRFWRRKKKLPASPTLSQTPAGGQAEPSLSTPVSKEARWRRGLSRLRNAFGRPFEHIGYAGQGQPASETVFSELEEVLIGADVGVQTASQLIDQLRDRSLREQPADSAALRLYLQEEIRSVLQGNSYVPPQTLPRPWVILVVGVNGVGKTTCIAKLGARLKGEDKKVLLVAGDTFRAAAIEQLSLWAERLGLDVIKHQHGASPSAVVYDGMRAAVAREADVVLIDTAGRLHTKAPLMEELKKILRVIDREIPGAPHDVFLVLDAATGQNALNQARTFQTSLPLTGVILSKMDGSAKGGITLAVSGQLGVPIRYIGLGEQVEDLEEFIAEDFITALFDEITPFDDSTPEISLDDMPERP